MSVNRWEKDVVRGERVINNIYLLIKFGAAFKYIYLSFGFVSINMHLRLKICVGIFAFRYIFYDFFKNKSHDYIYWTSKVFKPRF